LSFRLAAAALALAAAGCRAEPASNASQQPIPERHATSGLELVGLEVESGRRTHRFVVEVARTSDEQAQGLMFRRSLGPDEGMIFPFPSPRPANFWMRNTVIPLDMVFIRENGTIARIAANTVPMSEETVSSGEPVAAVLEIRGGRAAELGIRAGDRVHWPR
jgi:hypothetical protein